MKGKRIKLFLILIFLMVFVWGCSEKSNLNYKTEKMDYNDVLDFHQDIYIVNDQGLYYLVKNGKKISKGYITIINPCTESVSDKYIDYFIAKTKNSDYVIVNHQGQEKPINHEVVSYLGYTKYGFLFKNEDKKAVYMTHNGETFIYDNILLANRCLDEDGCIKYLIGTNDIEENETESFLLNAQGEIIISDVSLIEVMFLSYPTEQTFFKVKQGDKFKLLNAELEIVMDNLDGLEVRNNNLIRCLINSYDSNNPSQLTDSTYTYYNSLNQSISFKMSEGFSYEEGPYFVAVANSLLNFKIYRFNDEMIECTSFQRYNMIYKFQNSSTNGFLNYSGEIIYSDANQLSSVTDYHSYTQNYVIRNSSNVVLTDTETTKTLTFPSSSAYSYSINTTQVNGTFLIIRNSAFGIQKALYSLKHTESNININNLSYYDQINVYRTAGINYALVSDYENEKLFIVDLDDDYYQLLISDCPQGYNPIIINNIFANIDIYRELNTINGFAFTINSSLSDFSKSFIIYRNQIYNGGEKADLKVMAIDETNVISTPGFNEVFIYNNNSTDVYQFVYDNDEYTLTYKTTIPFQITAAKRDAHTLKVYYVIRNEINPSYKGLCDDEGNIIFYPHFNNIVEIENNNVIVERFNYFGVIKITNKSYKVLVKMVYSNIGFIGDGNFIVFEDYTKRYFCDSTGKLNNDEILLGDIITYLSLEDDEYVTKHAYKLIYSDYVMIYRQEKIIKIYSHQYIN